MITTAAQVLLDIASNSGINRKANRETVRRYRLRRSFLEVSISEREVVLQAKNRIALEGALIVDDALVGMVLV